MAFDLLKRLHKHKRNLFLHEHDDDAVNSPNESSTTNGSNDASSTEKRLIYVNMEIPPDEVDDYGQPTTQFISNQINTAKYTWYTFLPKNLFEQFRGVANLYFLFLVVIQMFPLFSTSASPVLVVLPLAAILVLTGAKDAVEDNKRHKTDESVNKAITYTLSNWKNVNIPVYQVPVWRRWLYSLKRLLLSPSFSLKRLNKNQQYELQVAGSGLQRTDTNFSTSSANRLSFNPPKSPSVTSSIRNTLKSTASFSKMVISAKKRKSRMPYRPGQVPHSVLRSNQHYLDNSKGSSGSSGNDNKKKRQSSSARQQLDKRWRRTLWENIKVGDFICLRNGDGVPADMVVLSTSEPDGLCYVETQNLDGETNLKIKRSLQATNEISTPEDCEKSKFYIESEAPHANLYSYNGVLKWKVEHNDLIRTETSRRRGGGENGDDEGFATVVSSNESAGLTTINEREARQYDEEEQHAALRDDEDIQSLNSDDTLSAEVSHEKTEAITASSILLRGCVLRNTGWVIGLVLFTGNDTKIMLNSGKTPSKRSRIEKATNPYVIVNFVLLLILCLICSIAASIVYNNETSASFFESKDAESGAMEGFIMFWTTLVIYQNIIPISLYISVQIVKTAAAYFIHTDIDMYNEKLDQPCIPKTWNISDDLGQIEYIFSDKTGTLTQNIMEFRRCTINGVCYGMGDTEASIGAKLRDEDTGGTNTAIKDSVQIATQLDLDKARAEMLQKQRELFNHEYINSSSTFVDPQLFDDIKEQNEQSQSIVHFFSALALCHTVIPEIPDDEPHKIEYKAQSPDEAALVATAKDIGFTFIGREQDNVMVDIMGEQRTFQLLHVLEFNSTRKRMSVIMRSPQDNKIILLCKGADSVIYERLSTGLEEKQDEASKHQLKLRQDTLQHLGVFANEGLRTLCIASRVIEEEEYQQWATKYKAASNSIRNRDEKIEEVCEEIETSLTLIGGTAIEDKLQEGVPDTIAVLAEAGIKIWVLTGDKVETAINIGFACNLLTKDMLLININSRSEEETTEQLRRSLEEVVVKSQTQKCALVIDGESLKFALDSQCKQELLELGTQCRAVICCRVSPMQKAKVVNLVKKGLNVMTLAIGDGANDVSMIQEANVGIGISGEEGRQAVMASDYAIGQFKYLSKLLLVHGRWSYLRTSEMIFTFFYKNIMWTFVLFWYQFVCGFSGTMMFDYSYITLYNLVFTSLPCIFAGVFDQDLKADYSFRFPQLYLLGIRNDKFTTSRFLLTVVDAIYQSVICFIIPYMVFVGPKLSSNGYDTEGVIELGTFIAGIAVVVANVLVGFTIFSWTWIIMLCIFLSCTTFFIWVGIYSNILTFTFYGEAILFSQGAFWLCLILTITICLLPRYIAKYFLQVYYPFDNDIVRERVLCGSSNYYSELRASALNMLNTGNPTELASFSDEEEVVPINLERTRSSEHSNQQQQYRFNLPFGKDKSLRGKKRPSQPHFGLYRSETNNSQKSEIMNMKTGQRISFTGFAYSSDDSHVFDEYRKSVYRTNTDTTYISRPFGSGSSSRMPATNKNSNNSQDWMPIQSLQLQQSENEEPSLLTSTKLTNKRKTFSKKMMHAVTSKILSAQHSSTSNSVNNLPIVPITNISSSLDDKTETYPTEIPTMSNEELAYTLSHFQPIEPNLLHDHHQSSHYSPTSPFSKSHNEYDLNGQEQLRQQQSSPFADVSNRSSSTTPSPTHY